MKKVNNLFVFRNVQVLSDIPHKYPITRLMPRSDPHVPMYELPHGLHVRPRFVTRLCRSKSTQLHVTVYLQVEIHKEIWKLKGIKMPRLNNENRTRALGMLECGISQNDVARRFGVSRSTIARLVQRVNTTGSLSDRPRSGAPRVTSVRQDVLSVNVTCVTALQRHNRRFLLSSVIVDGL